MTNANSYEVIKTVGMAVIKSAHDRFEFDCLDNEEHIPALKKTIEAIINASGKFLESSCQNQLRTRLRTYALDLFIELWLREDDVGDDKGPVIEKKRAIKLFEEIYG